MPIPVEITISDVTMKNISDIVTMACKGVGLHPLPKQCMQNMTMSNQDILEALYLEQPRLGFHFIVGFMIGVAVSKLQLQIFLKRAKRCHEVLQKYEKKCEQDIDFCDVDDLERDLHNALCYRIMHA